MPHTLENDLRICDEGQTGLVKADTAKPQFVSRQTFRRTQFWVWGILLLSCPSLFAEQAAPTGIAVVELFTSEGCSSCPPADRLLLETRQAAQKSGNPVYVLSYHVEYWDDLGWDDPFGLPVSTRRQQLYSQVLGTDRVYTPQMVVNGSVEFVGSNRKRVEAEIAQALLTQATVHVQSQAKQSDDKIEVTATVDKAPPECSLMTVLVQREATQLVAKGENSKRRLTHVNIVRVLHSVPLKAVGQQVATLTLPEGLKASESEVISFVQHRSGAIHGATHCTIDLKDATP